MNKFDFTPENITSLKDNEVFVFGSNLNGNHAGGAARVAMENFNAVMGQAEGLQGQSYAIPTLDKDMKQLPEEDLKSNISKFFDFALANPDKTFYLTKIGCGIAGYDTEYMSAIVRSFDYPENVIFPKEFYKVKTYKIFNPDFTCRDFQYEVGKEYTHDRDIKACESGFHACKNPFDALHYYPLINEKGQMMKFAQVEQSGAMVCSTDKICSKRIRINAELNLAGFIKAGIEWIKSYTDPKKIGISTSTNNDSRGDFAQIGSSGDFAQIGSSGDYAQIGSSGDFAQIGSSGYGAKIGSSGNDAQIGSSGNDAKIGSSGYGAQIGSSGNDAKIGSSGYGAKIGSSGNDAQIGSSGNDAQIGSSGYGAQIGSSGYGAKIGSSGYGAKIGSSGYGAQIGSSGNDAKIGSSGYGAKIGSSGNGAKIGSSGYGAKIGSSGDFAQIGSSGDFAQIGSSGYGAKIGSSGDYAQIGSSGDYAQIGSSGDFAQIGSSGDFAQIGSSGDFAQINSSGEDSVICCAGKDSMAKAKVGSWITLAEWVYNKEKQRYVPTSVKTEYVDGERIKADIWYRLQDGEFVEQNS